MRAEMRQRHQCQRLEFGRGQNPRQFLRNGVAVTATVSMTPAEPPEPTARLTMKKGLNALQVVSASSLMAGALQAALI